MPGPTAIINPSATAAAAAVPAAACLDNVPALPFAADIDAASLLETLKFLVVLVTLCLLCLLAGLVYVYRESRRLAAPVPPAMCPAKGAAVAAADAAPGVASTGAPVEGGGCPFGHTASVTGTTDTDSSESYKHPGPRRKKESARDAAKRRVITLYEDYIHLHDLACVWDNPVTDTPRLEPSFAAGMHGIELAFMLMAEFIRDSRSYVVRRPRIEMVAEDIVAQCKLLQEIVDGELEDEACVGARQHAATLTQDFPFEAAPPTLAAGQPGYGRQSPGLNMLIDAVARGFRTMSGPERQSVIRVVHNVTGQFELSFRRWTVGVGCEEQLAQLRECVGLPPTPVRPLATYLDYSVLVRPMVCANTLLQEAYVHKEDFFFRTVHLGTECWGFVALGRLRSALEQVECHSHWQNAAAHVNSCAHILEYLGTHITMLTSMVLR